MLREFHNEGHKIVSPAAYFQCFLKGKLTKGEFSSDNKQGTFRRISFVLDKLFRATVYL